MAIKYLQLFSDMLDDHFEPLTDEELGIIIRASMKYAFEDIEPEFERRSVLDLTWRRMRKHIEQCVASAEKMATLGKSGGEASAAKRSQADAKREQAEPKRSQAKGNRSQAASSEGQARPSESNQYQDQDQYKDQDQYHDQYQEHEQDQDHEDVGTRAREARRFHPPTVDEVRAYCQERGNRVDPQRFVDHYTSNGWRVGGKSSMKDWKAAVRNWEGNEYGSTTRDSPANQGILTRTEEHARTPDFWKSLEVNLDEVDFQGRMPGDPGYGT